MLFVNGSILSNVHHLCSSTNLTELAKACRMIAALQPHEKGSDDLLNAARRLAGATANLLKASQPENLEVIIYDFLLLQSLTFVCPQLESTGAFTGCCRDG